MKLALPPDIINEEEWKKLESIERRDGKSNSWCTGKDTEMNTING